MPFLKNLYPCKAPERKDPQSLHGLSAHSIFAYMTIITYFLENSNNNLRIFLKNQWKLQIFPFRSKKILRFGIIARKNGKNIYKIVAWDIDKPQKKVYYYKGVLCYNYTFTQIVN